MFFGRKKWDPKGLHVYITGGSQGLGLSTAVLLAKKGANVSIVARRKEHLDTALQTIETARVSPNQTFKAYSFSLGTYKESKEALESVCKEYGGAAPDAVFNCAGSSKPGWWVDATEEDLANGMTQGYWVEAWTTLLASQLMIKQRKAGAKIILVSSTIGYMTFMGHGTYAPAKQALRGLSDTLESELQLYGIDMHCYFPPTMYTPGYLGELEAGIKPGPQLKIEDGDQPLTADQGALALIKGVEAHKQHITGNLITEIFRASTRGSTRPQSYLIDPLLDLIGFIGIPIWRATADRHIMAAKASHMQDLESRGFFDTVHSSS